MGKTEDIIYASDKELLSISKRFIRQNKEAYEELEKRANPHEDMADTQNHCLESYQKMQI